MRMPLNSFIYLYTHMQNIVVSQNYTHLHVTKTIVPDFYYHCYMQMGVKIPHYIIYTLQRALFLKFIAIRTCVYEYLRSSTSIVMLQWKEFCKITIVVTLQWCKKSGTRVFVMCRRMFRSTCGTFRPGHAAKKMKLSMD